MKTNNKLRLAAIILFGGMFFLQSCKKEDETVLNMDDANVAQQDQAKVNPYESNAVIKPWFIVLNDLIKNTPGHTPPIAAREIAYTSIALYEATSGGVNGYKSLAGQLQGLGALPQRVKANLYLGPVAANAAAARIITSLFGNATVAGLASINALEASNDAVYAGLYSAADIARSQQFGRDIADAIYLYSQSDGGHQAYTAVFPASYVPPVGPGLWTPTSAQLIPMLPYWGSNRTFVAANSSPLIDPPAPLAYDATVGSPFYNEALKVYNVGLNLTQAQKDIANFWADGGGTYTPPGHMTAIAVQLVSDRNMILSKSVFILARLGITLSDAAVACWRTKYSHNLLRPVSYIKANIDPNWSSFIGTPPFPAYTSGHSSFSGGAARIIVKEFGCKPFTDNTKVALGFPPRYFNCINTAAQEAAVSRLYGGIHYEFDNTYGYNCGVIIANNVMTNIIWR